MYIVLHHRHAVGFVQYRLSLLVLLIAGLVTVSAWSAGAADIFLRCRIVKPAGARFRVSVGGYRHTSPWTFPDIAREVSGADWSAWLDLSPWPWHGRLDRAGGVAEWPTLKLSIARIGSEEPIQGCEIEVQLADKPDGEHVVLSFREPSGANAIAFLVPNPLRPYAKEFETGSQMTARHLRWAREAVGAQPPLLKEFQICTALWGYYDPELSRQDTETVRLLGFNVVSGTKPSFLRSAGLRSYGSSWLYQVDPEAATREWNAFTAGALARALSTDEGRWQYANLTHWVVSDEVSTLDFRGVDPAKRDGWFRDYLRRQKVTDAEIGRPIGEAEYPATAMYANALPRDADLPTRRQLYYAARFGQEWSAAQLRHSTDLIHAGLHGLKTETLPTDHGFFNAWGPPYLGMSYRLLDLFALGAQQSVDELSAEDWLGLNHMYGPGYTWTGAQSFAYLNALLRSAIGVRPILLRGLITPGDDRYLRLKACSGLGQGAKSFFFWTYGPTYIGTENYWSDLKSEYVGIAHLNSALQRAEEILYPARPVSDPVAILYSVSHDIWYPDDPAAFVEKRLLWHALRHLGVQPDFLPEEDLADRLKSYKVLYIADWCVSRKAAAAIDAWVRAGGVLYLSAGAATRDEFCEPYVPSFAAALWPPDAAQRMIAESHRYNERTDLPTIRPMTTVKVRIAGEAFTLPALGCRAPLRRDSASPFATFADGSPAGALVSYGRGKVVGLGFLPMLAYGQGAGFKPTTLEEKWPSAPRALIDYPLALAKIRPVAHASVPVVEASLLTGPKGSALVLANYTYRPIRSLTVDLNVAGPIARAISTEGRPVRLRRTPMGVRLELPLDWTDIILLPKK
jgi:hypothetical protein